ncbi:MAG: DNA repair protein RecO [Patescibacteria group bacterium]|nr:DNA repair protein RecO [Patescibacteria group bacterium]
MRSFGDEAVVIRRQYIGEADVLLTLFTRGHGKIRVLAKGSRKINSRRGGNLDLLNHIKVLVSHGRTFDLLNQAETVNSFAHLKKRVEDISKAYYLCELTDKLSAEGEPSVYIFELLLETLANFLNKTTPRIWDFEFRLLEHLGFISASQRQGKKGLRVYVEEILERELKTPTFYHHLLKFN